MIKRLLLVVVLAFFLRVIYLGTIPNGIYVDDAAIGYNAYSILMTGKDEYGQKMPLFLKSWNAFTPALVTYFAVVPIRMFGLSVWSLRITPVLIGTLTVLMLGYVAGKKWLLPASLLMAINPTHILFSRSFYEGTLSILLFGIGIALYRRKNWLLFIFLALSTYSYHTTRLLSYPLVLFIVWEQVRLRNINKSFILGILIFILSQIPQFVFATSSGSSQNLLSKSWISEMHQPVAIVREFASQYLSYISPRSLFHLPDPDPQRSFPGVSEFYTWLVVPYFVGLIYLLKNWRQHKLLIFLFLIFPIPAALAKDPFSTLRASLGLIPLNIIMAMGIVSLRFRYKNLLLGLFLALSLLTLYRSLFVLLPNERKIAWNYGYDQVFKYISNQTRGGVVDTGKPVYILYLFYQKIDPRYVQSLTKSVKSYYSYSDWQNYYHDNHVEFRPLVWKTDIYKSQYLIGDLLLVSANQAREHSLSNELSIENLQVYKTHPDLKCANETDYEPLCHIKLP